MPFLHWATSGANFKHRDSVIKQLAEEFKDSDYQRPSLETINQLESAPKMRVLRSFLHPAKDSCLHIRRTLDQYYYSTVEDADERTEDQVVYKFAKKQHHRLMEEKLKAEARRKKKEKEQESNRARSLGESRKRHSRTDSSESSSKFAFEVDSSVEIEDESSQKSRNEQSWDPPKVMMVNQLWMWIVDGGKLCSKYSTRVWGNFFEKYPPILNLV